MIQKTRKSPDSQLAKIESPFAPARAHAQRAFEHGMALANEAVLCGLELIRLQFAHGISHGGDRKSAAAKIKTAACGLDSASWPELVQREVGISDDTARRWMQAARAQLPALAGKLGYDFDGVDCEPPETDAAAAAYLLEYAPERLAEAVAQLSDGKTLEQLLLPLDGNGAFDPSKLVGKARDAWEKVVAFCEPFDEGILDGLGGWTREHYDAWHEDALVIRARVEAGEIPPTRAWAGLRGRAATDADGGRAPVDYYRNLNVGLTKLRTSFARWNDLSGGEREQVEANWRTLWESIPGSIKSDVKKLEGWK